MKTPDFTLILKGRVSAGAVKRAQKVVNTVASFLPSHPSSPWPKEIRRTERYSYFATILAAFDGSIGASCQLGIAFHPALAGPKCWAAGMSPYQKSVFEHIADGPWLITSVLFPVDELKTHALSPSFRRQTVLVLPGRKDRFVLNTQDILRLVGAAKSFGKKEIKLIQINQLDRSNDHLLTFRIIDGFNVHLIAEHGE